MSEKCIKFIGSLKAEVKLYEDRYKIWKDKLDKLIEERDDAWEKYDKADLALSNTEPTVRTAIRRYHDYWNRDTTCSNWSADECKDRCSTFNKDAKTPLGRKVEKYDYHRPSSYNSGCVAGRWNCVCITPQIDASGVIKLGIAWEDKKRAIESHQKPENVPKPPDIDVQCCKNEILCNDGKCYGNIQICQNYINSQVSMEDEKKIIDNIKLNDKLIDESINNFNTNISNLNSYYTNFKEVESTIKENKNLNISLTFSDIKSIFEFAKTSFDIIFTNLETIYNYYSDIIANSGRIKTAANKSEISPIIDSVKKKVQSATDDYTNNIDKYAEIKTLWEKLELHKNNLDTMISKKNLIDDKLNIYNDNIGNINNINKQINSLIIVDDKDLYNLTQLVTNMNNIYNNQIIINKNSINDLYKEVRILFNTIPPSSIFYNIANRTMGASNSINTSINGKTEEIKGIINNLGNIEEKKKRDYDALKKLNEDTKLLASLEEQENKIKSDLLLLQLLENEEKNKNTSAPVNIIETPINITEIPFITQSPFFTEMPVSITPQPVKMDFIIYIIVGVVVVIIIFVIYMNK
jgi:hypothetical protein